ncbi:phage tailspike protein [Yersinia enterocolitica]|uniref:phage tailspike protein n=1 Tax=Yersinia enterocolitica TaxID=630 RepID=UPI00330C5293|nr:hypothetical protein [Yersinia enterocolitica]
MPDIIPNVVVSMPSQLFTMPRKFGAVFNGKIYIGLIDTDPTIPSNQIQVYLENEDGSLVPMAQPIIINAGGYPVYNGQVSKFVTVEGHSMAVYDSLNVQQFYFPNVLKYDPDQLQQRLSSDADGEGDALVAVKQPFNGSAPITQHDKNAQVCHIEDFPREPLSTWFRRAVSGTPAGGVLHLGSGPYIGNYVETRSNITIIGCGPAPIANSGRTALVAGTGTIIQGSTKFLGSNIKLINIGFDNGNDVVANLNNGVEGDALVVSNVGTSTTPNANNHVINVSTIAKLNSSTSHSCLLENFAYGRVIGVKAYGGFVGVVCKLQNCFIDDISGFRQSQSGIQFKSNSYAICGRNVIGRVFADDEGGSGASSVGVFFFAEDGQLQQLNGAVISVRGFENAVGITQASSVINDINIESINSESPRAYGLITNGGILSVSIGSVICTGSLAGRSVRVGNDCLGISIGSITASSPPGINLDDSVYLGGVFNVGLVTTTVAYTPGDLAGITISPSLASVRAWGIGSYIGRLISNNITLQNGWVGAGGNTPTLRLNANCAVLNAYLGVPTSKAGAEVWSVVPAGMRPLSPQTFSCVGFVSGITSPVPLIGMVNTAGAVYFPYLSNSAQFPTNISAVAVNVQWPIK